MASLHELLKARFKMASDDLEQVLDRLTDEDLTWAPREGMNTIGDLLLEIVNKEREAKVWIQEGVWPDDEEEPFAEQSSTIAGIMAAMHSTRVDTLAYIDSLSEDELSQLVSCPERWWEALRLTECPISEVLRNVAAHEWYHTGQLVSYLWMRGDDPNSW